MMKGEGDTSGGAGQLRGAGQQQQELRKRLVEFGDDLKQLATTLKAESWDLSELFLQDCIRTNFRQNSRGVKGSDGDESRRNSVMSTGWRSVKTGDDELRGGGIEGKDDTEDTKEGEKRRMTTTEEEEEKQNAEDKPEISIVPVRLAGRPETIVRTFIECGMNLPVKSSFYAAWIALWNNGLYKMAVDKTQRKGVDDVKIYEPSVWFAFGQACVDTLSFEVDVKLKNGDLATSLIGLRFAADLANCGVVDGKSLFSVLKHLLKASDDIMTARQAQLQNSLQGPSTIGARESIVGAPDGIILLVMGTLPFISAEVCTAHEKDFTEVWEALAAYMSTREKPWSKLNDPIHLGSIKREVKPHEGEDGPSGFEGEAEALQMRISEKPGDFLGSETSPDRLELLWTSLQELRLKEWKSECIIRLYFSAQLVEEVRSSPLTPHHSLRPFTFTARHLAAAPHADFVQSGVRIWQPENLTKTFPVAKALLSAPDIWLLEDIITLTMYTFRQDPVLCAERLLTIPVFHPCFEAHLVQHIISEMIRLPFSRHSVLFYESLLLRLAQLQNSVLPIIEETLRLVSLRLPEWDRQTLETLSDFHGWWLSISENYKRLDDQFLRRRPWTFLPFGSAVGGQEEESPIEPKEETMDSQPKMTTSTTADSSAEAAVEVVREVDGDAPMQGAAEESTDLDVVKVDDPLANDDEKLPLEFMLVAPSEARILTEEVRRYFGRVLDRLARLVWRPAVADSITKRIRPLLPIEPTPNCEFLPVRPAPYCGPEMDPKEEEEKQEDEKEEEDPEAVARRRRYASRKKLVEFDLLRKLMKYSLGSDHERENVSRLVYLFMLQMIDNPRLNTEPENLLLCLVDANTLTAEMTHQFNIIDVTKEESDDDEMDMTDGPGAKRQRQDATSLGEMPTPPSIHMNSQNHEGEADDSIKPEDEDHIEDGGRDEIKDEMMLGSVKPSEKENMVEVIDADTTAMNLQEIKTEWDYNRDTTPWTADEVVEIFTKVVLAQGAKSFTHFERILDYYGEIFRRFRPSSRGKDPNEMEDEPIVDELIKLNDMDYFVSIVHTVFAFWRFGSLKCSLCIRKLIARHLIPVEAVIQYIGQSLPLKDIDTLQCWEILKCIVTDAREEALLAEDVLRTGRRTFESEERLVILAGNVEAASKKVTSVICSILSALIQKLDVASEDIWGRKHILYLILAFGRLHLKHFSNADLEVQLSGANISEQVTTLMELFVVVRDGFYPSSEILDALYANLPPSLSTAEIEALYPPQGDRSAVVMMGSSDDSQISALLHQTVGQEGVATSTSVAVDGKLIDVKVDDAEVEVLM